MEQPGTRVGISKIYIKDLSFESPLAPQVFQSEFNPKVGLDVQVEARPIQDALHEVTLNLTVKASAANEKVYFIVEIEQAGLFNIETESQDQLDRILQVFCPSALFPYARQAIDNALTSGGFPPLMLAPINFEQFSEATAPK